MNKLEWNTDMEKLVAGRAKHVAQQYYCVFYGNRENYLPYTKTILEDLDSVGKVVFYERAEEYDPEKGAASTYLVPYLDRAMRDYLDQNLGNLSLSHRSMQLVRKAQMLYHSKHKTVEQIAEELSVSRKAVSEALNYGTHFWSFDDLDWNVPREDGDEGDPAIDRISKDGMWGAAEEEFFRQKQKECLRLAYAGLSKREQDILDKSFGLNGQPEESLADIAMYHMISEDAVEKAKKRALGKLRKALEKSEYAILRAARREVERAKNEATVFSDEAPSHQYLEFPSPP